MASVPVLIPVPGSVLSRLNPSISPGQDKQTTNFVPGQRRDRPGQDSGTAKEGKVKRRYVATTQQRLGRVQDSGFWYTPGRSDVTSDDKYFILRHLR